MTAAVGLPDATSRANVGPDSAATRAWGKRSRTSSLMRTWRPGSKPFVAETIMASRGAGTVASVAPKNSDGTTITITSAPSTAAATSAVACTAAGTSKSGM